MSASIHVIFSMGAWASKHLRSRRRRLWPTPRNQQFGDCSAKVLVWCCLGSAMGRRTAMDTPPPTTASPLAVRHETAINFTDRIWHASTPYFRRKWRHRTAAAAPDSADRKRPACWAGVGLATRPPTTRTSTAVAGIPAAVAGCRPSRRPGPPTPSPTCRAP